MMLSTRLQQACTGNSFLNDAFAKVNKNPYDPKHNAEGIINLGTAENKMIFDLIKEKLPSNMKEMPEKCVAYTNFAGSSEFRDHVARLINAYMKPSLPVDRENTFIINGCGPAIETLMFSFCDEGQGCLTPAPFYGTFDMYVRQRMKAVLYPFEVTSAKLGQEYKLTVSDIEEAIKNAKNDGIEIKALLLSNPRNPTGAVVSLEQMESYAECCYRHNIHLICDEIYFFSVHDHHFTKKSVLSSAKFEKYKDILHVVWGFSKDFGLSGFRCGIIITHNLKLMSSLNEISLFTAVPYPIQYMLGEMISDFKWLDKFFKLNQDRLRERLNIVTETLECLHVTYIKPTGGLFIWLNLKPFMHEHNENGEKQLFSLFIENKLYIAPGFAFGSQQWGWFRIVFSVETNQLILAMKKLKNILAEIKTKKSRNK